MHKSFIDDVESKIGKTLERRSIDAEVAQVKFDFDRASYNVYRKLLEQYHMQYDEALEIRDDQSG